MIGINCYCQCFVIGGLPVALKLPPPKASLFVVGTGCLHSERLVGVMGTCAVDVPVTLDMHVWAMQPFVIGVGVQEGRSITWQKAASQGHAAAPPQPYAVVTPALLLFRLTSVYHHA